MRATTNSVITRRYLARIRYVSFDDHKKSMVRRQTGSLAKLKRFVSGFIRLTASSMLFINFTRTQGRFLNTFHKGSIGEASELQHANAMGSLYEDPGSSAQQNWRGFLGTVDEREIVRCQVIEI